MDFALDQLDVKKKTKAKLGSEVILRLRFESPSVGDTPSEGEAVGTRGYELVARSDNTSAEV